MSMSAEKLYWIPGIERTEVLKPSGFDKKEVKNKYLSWLFNKVFNLMLKKGFLKQQTLIEKNVTMRQHTIDMDKLDYEICQNQQAIEMVYGNRVDTIIVGADIMRKFMTGDPYKMGRVDLQMSQVSNHSGFSRAYPSDFGLERHYERVRYMGINVICIPWFKGFLLIPKKESY